MPRKKAQKEDEKLETRVAIYTRVSTEDQAKEGFSLGAQMDRLKSYCEARDWVIFKEFVDDGYSGRKINRPAYQEMMEDIESWDILLVLKMDRIHRNSKNFMEMMDSLRQHDREFVSMNESLDTSTAMGRFVMDIIQRIAQLESEQIGERVFAGMQQKAQTPVEKLDPERSPYLGFGHPFGYDYKDGTLYLNEKEAQAVIEIYKMYKSGKSLSTIIKHLKNKGVPPKRGKKWHKMTISKILKNPLYYGYLRWDGILREGPHPKIIGKTEFDEVQEILAKKAKLAPNA